MVADMNQERDLALLRRIRLDDPRGKEEMVQKYLPMVKHIVRKHYASFLEFDDLMQEGFIGLLAAIQEYKPEYHVKFSSFAYICIIRKVYNAIKQSNGNKHRLLNNAISLYSYVNCDETRTIMDLVSDEESASDPVDMIEAKMVQQKISELLSSHLSLLEYKVVTLLLDGYTCSEIEKKIGVKAKVVDNARTRAKLKLRKLLKTYGSLLSPSVPTKVRRRKDLYLNLRFGS